MSFAYDNLSDGEIRLLDFLDDSGMQCTLEPCALSSAPQYIALSYTWNLSNDQRGPPTNETYQITLNGQLLTVQENLHEALRHLAKEVRAKSCKFWVDFICINQMDTKERNSQVRIMKNIYKGSNAVFAWLGLPRNDKDTPLGVAFMTTCWYYLSTEVSSDGKVLDSAVLTAKLTEDHILFPRERERAVIAAWDAILEMLERRYWHRTWSLLEATTPGEVTFFCGSHKFHHRDFTATLYYFEQWSQFPSFQSRYGNKRAIGARTLASARTLIDGRRGGEHLRLNPSLLDIMKGMQTTQCEDSRDHVFAPLGYASDGAQGFIAIDYDRKPSEVYIDVVRYAVHKTKGLSILGSVFTPAPDSVEPTLRQVSDIVMPSWVPDWSRGIPMPTLGTLDGTDGHKVLYAASGDKVLNASISGAELKLYGFTLDAIEYVAKIWEGSEVDFGTPRAWRRDLICQGVSFSNETMKRTLVADLRFNEVGGGTRADRTRGGSLDWQLVQTLPSRLPPPSRAQRAHMRRQLAWTCYSRRAGFTLDKRIGIFPAAAARGDLVAVFYGGAVPCVVRPQSDPDRLRFIGECYLDGMMDGEAMQIASKHRIAARTLILV